MRKWLVAMMLLQTVGYGSIEVKEAIKKNLSRLENGEATDAIYLELALLYQADQELDKAFEAFLKSLENTKGEKSYVRSSEEDALYQEALALYMTQGAINPTETAKKIIERYEEVVLNHPDYNYLNAIVAVSYGNISGFELFFKNFSRAYPFLKESYLAYKTQGILHLKLSVGKTEEKRKAHKKQGAALLEAALQQNPCDASLYKMLISFAKERKECMVIDDYLEKMVKHSCVMPRSDISFYVQEAVERKEFEIGAQLIELAKAHYGYSRACVEAQEYLNLHKGLQ